LFVLDCEGCEHDVLVSLAIASEQGGQGLEVDVFVVDGTSSARASAALLARTHFLAACIGSEDLVFVRRGSAPAARWWALGSEPGAMPSPNSTLRERCPQFIHELAPLGGILDEYQVASNPDEQRFLTSLRAAAAVRDATGEATIVRHLHAAFDDCPQCAIPAMDDAPPSGNGIVSMLRMYSGLDERRVFLGAMRRVLEPPDVRRVLYVGVDWYTLQYEHIATALWGVDEWVTTDTEAMKAALFGSRSGRSLALDLRMVPRALGESCVDAVVILGLSTVLSNISAREEIFEAARGLLRPSGTLLVGFGIRTRERFAFDYFDRFPWLARESPHKTAGFRLADREEWRFGRWAGDDDPLGAREPVQVDEATSPMREEQEELCALVVFSWERILS
jgi:hypothetical protein